MPSNAANRSLDIVDTLLDEGTFQTLMNALKTAGMVDTLKGAGPYTLFAPTDQAFAALPAGTLTELEKPANREKLCALLQGHVVEDIYHSSVLRTLMSIDSLTGVRLRIKTDGHGIHLGGAVLMGSDIACTNGIIHAVDTVFPLTETIPGNPDLLSRS